MTDLAGVSGRVPAVVVAVVVLGAVAACSGGDLVLPQPQAAAQLAVVSGNQQTGTVGEVLPEPLVVELRDEQGRPIVGRQVAFVVIGGPAAAQLQPDMAVTDDDGRVTGLWTLGTTPGIYTGEARFVASDDEELSAPEPLVAQLTASAQPGPPDTLRAESRLTQSGRAGQNVADPPTVRVIDRYGNPVSGAAVQWQVTAGSGVISAAVTTADIDGRATVTWTLGNQFVQRLTASIPGNVTGSPISFSAVVF